MLLKKSLPPRLYNYVESSQFFEVAPPCRNILIDCFSNHGHGPLGIHLKSVFESEQNTLVGAIASHPPSNLGHTKVSVLVDAVVDLVQEVPVIAVVPWRRKPEVVPPNTRAPTNYLWSTLNSVADRSSCRCGR